MISLITSFLNLRDATRRLPLRSPRYNFMHRDPEAVMVVVPADHVVTAPKKFMRAVQFATKLAAQGHLVTFGIHPSRPETGYGYIQPNKRKQLRIQGAFVGYPVV